MGIARHQSAATWKASANSSAPDRPNCLCSRARSRCAVTTSGSSFKGSSSCGSVLESSHHRRCRAHTRQLSDISHQAGSLTPRTSAHLVQQRTRCPSDGCQGHFHTASALPGRRWRVASPGSARRNTAAGSPASMARYSRPGPFTYISVHCGYFATRAASSDDDPVPWPTR